MNQILVVEDDVVIADNVQRTLLGLGYDVPTTASSADEAVRAVERSQPDLVLMDIKLKGKRDGIEATAIIRSRWDVPVIFLTSYADEATLARARETGPHGFLHKPFNERDLRTAIEVALRKHDVEVKLAERERWFSTTLQAIDDAVIATDARERITFMNANAEQLTGWRRGDALGKPLGEVFRLVEENLSDDASDGIVRRSRFSVAVPENLRLLTREGQRHAVSDASSPIIDDRGKVLGALVVFRDVTERHRLEQRLALSERMASIGTMAAGVAHEINNPLTAVVGNVSFAREVVKRLLQIVPAASLLAPAVARDFEALGSALEDAEDAALRVRSIAQNLHKFAYADLRRELLDLPDVLDSALKMAQNHIHHEATVVRAYGTTPFVEANEGSLVQVFTHLLLNAAGARKDGDHGYEIHISTGTDDTGRAVVSIRDTGAGIAAGIMPKIFEPFFTTKQQGEGAGLGLSIVLDVITALGGEIAVESEVSSGTTVRVALVAATSASQKPPSPMSDSPPKRRGRVLVIDDEESVGRAVARVLGELHDVVFEVDARLALARCVRGEVFDVIYCDLMMPGLTGVDVYRALAASHPELARRVVFLTGGVFSERAAEFLKGVAALTVPKPFTASSLRAITADYIS